MQDVHTSKLIRCQDLLVADFDLPSQFGMLWRLAVVHVLPLADAVQQHIGVELNLRSLVVSLVLNLPAFCMAIAQLTALLSQERAKKIKWYKRATGSGSGKGN